MVKNTGTMYKLFFPVLFSIFSSQSVFAQTSMAETAFDTFVKEAQDQFYVISLKGKITDPTASGTTTVIAIRGVSANNAKPTIKGISEPDTCTNAGHHSKLGQVTASMQTPDAYLLGVNYGEELFAMNANYFDVTPQTDGSKNATTWQATSCSAPLGNYYSNGNISAGSPVPTHFSSGPQDFMDASGGNITPLSSLSISFHPSTASLAVNGIYDPAAVPGRSNFDYDGVTEKLAADFKNIGSAGSGQLTVVSGVNLVPGFTPSINGIGGGAANGADAGEKNTTRIALGYVADTDTLIVIEGGGYKDGYSRDDLVRIMKNLGVKYAMEFDGGGSAGLAITSAAFTWYSGDAAGTTISKAEGAPADNSCSNAPQIYCSPVTQPSGVARPGPSWLVWYKG